MDELHFNIKKIMERNYYSCSTIDILMRHYNFKITSDTVLNDLRTLWLESYYYGKIKMNAKFGYYDDIIKRCKEQIILTHIYNYKEISYEWNGYNYYNNIID